MTTDDATETTDEGGARCRTCGRVEVARVLTLPHVTQEQVEHMAREWKAGGQMWVLPYDTAAKRDRAWMQWLARNGYGVDFAFDEAPPVPLTEYAEVLRDSQSGEETVDEWAWCIEQETGPWTHEGDA